MSQISQDRPLAPPRILDGGRAGAEAEFLLGEMIRIGRGLHVHPNTLGMAWTSISPVTPPFVFDTTAKPAQA